MERPTAQCEREDEGSIVAAIAGLENKLARKIDGITDEINDRIENLEREGRNKRRRRSRSPESRAKSTPPRGKRVDEPLTVRTDARRRSRSFHGSMAPHREEYGMAGDREEARNSEGASYQPADAVSARGGFVRPLKSPFYEVMSPRNIKDDERTDAVNELLVAASSALGKKRGNHILAPHKYVIRGNKGEKISMDDASWAEYFAALSRMVKDRALPSSWRDHLQEHIHQLATMATVRDWPTCRQWSEAVFTMISDGRLPYGWEDQYAIKDVQRDACVVGTRVNVKNPGKQNASDVVSKRSDYGNGATSTTRQNKGDYVRHEYTKENDGVPCYQWNWGTECGNNTSHGVHPDRKCHLCSWCATKYGKANVHPEKACQNKRRFLDKKNAEKGDQHQVFH